MPILTADQLARRRRTALCRARERQGWAAVVRDAATDRYRVTGRRGDTYWLALRDGGTACSCPAGEHAMPCWHSASLALSLAPADWRDAMGGE